MRQRVFVSITMCPLILIVLLLGIGKPAVLCAQTKSEVVATINEHRITEKEVDDSIISQLFPLQQQIYALRLAALENLVIRTVLEDTARQRGISVDELKRQLTTGRVEVPSAQVEQVYSENAAVFGAMSPDEAKERLRLDLESQARMKLYREALAELRKRSRIEVRLEEPRLLSISDIGTAPSLGSKDAIVTIVEFSDFQCPYCRGSQIKLKQVLQDYGSRVRLVFKYLPLDIHAQALASAQAAFCANEQGHFWQFQDALFSSEDLTVNSLHRIASNLDLKIPEFKACLSSERSRSAVLKDVAEARHFGINSTPTFIINGELVRGAISLEQLKAIVEQELKYAHRESRAQ